MTGGPVDSQLDVGRLRLLRQVELRGTIAAAARHLGLTASAVSQQLSVLERETGVALLDRLPRGVVLTGAGRALAERARLIEEVLEQARADLDASAGDPSGPVRIGAVASAAAALVSPAVTELGSSCPGLQVTVSVSEPAVSIAALLSADLDLAVVDVYDGVPLALSDYLVVTELLVEPLVVLGAPGSFAGKGTSLPQLANRRWVMPPETAACGQAVRFACRAEGFEPDVRWETDDMLLLASVVAAGHGVAVLPNLAVAAGFSLDVRPLARPRLNRRLVALTRTGALGRAVVSASLDALQTAANNAS
jgi:DNA-binding transcriptional LysR family regulator